MSYDAFMSYSHAADGKLAPALQAALHRFARSWYRRRALHVFRDTSSLAVTPALWSAIERALGQSDHFILLASPEAAASPWVQREVEYWRSHRPLERLLVVATAGRLTWDRAGSDFDWARTDALPEVLRGAFAEEPLYLDLSWARRRRHLSLADPRFRDAVATLASTLHGIPKDELIGEDVRRHRNAIRLAWSAVATLIVLLVATSITAWIAVNQREEALRQRDLAEQRQRLASSRQLQAQGEAALRRDPALLERGVLLTLESLRKAPSFEANQALRIGSELLPRRLAQFAHNDYVAGIAFSPDGALLASASSDRFAGLWRTASGELVAAMPHEKPVNALAFSPDGRFLATASSDATARVWRVPAGEPVLRLDHGGGVNAVAYSPSGRLLATASSDNSARVWDAVTGGEVLRLEHGATVNHVAFSPDEVWLASASGGVAERLLANLSGSQTTLDESARIWDLESGKEISRMAHDHGVQRVAFAPGGELVASTSLDGTARLWDPASGREIARLQHEDGVAAMAFAPSGRYLVTASGHFLLSTGDHWARLWEVPGGRELYRLQHADSVDSVILSPAARLIGTASTDRSARLWDSATGREIARAIHDSGVTAIAFAPDGGRYATADAGGAVRVWQTPDGHRFPRPQPTAGGGKLVVSPDGRLAAAPASAGGVLVWDIGTGRSRPRLAQDTQIHALDWDPAGRRLAGAALDGSVRVWNPTDGGEIARHTPGAEIISVRFGPGDLMAAAGKDQRVYVWGLPQTQTPLVLSQPAAVKDLAFAPDGGRLAAAGEDGEVRIWRLADGAEVLSLKHGSALLALAYSADGSLLAVASEDGIQVWRAEEGAEPRWLPGSGWAWDLAFSPDGAYLASADSERTATVWEVASGRRIAAIQHERSAQFVSFVGDGSLLASASGDLLVAGSDRVKLSLWHPDALATRACERLTRNLTQAEWAEHLPDETYRPTCPGVPVDLADALETPLALARQGDTDRARAAFSELAGWAVATTDAELNNAACWYGSLYGQAGAVGPACERAVGLVPDRGDFRDSRGLARAILGDPAGAASDFAAAAEWMRESGASEPAAKREAWVESLRAGGDPFDAATMEALREE